MVASTPIEERIESRLRMILTTILPQAIVRQCDDYEDASCAQMLYRTLVFAGPASKEDYVKMLETLTKPRRIELDKLYNAMIEFRFARTRMRKYGYREPEPSQLFETLKAASVTLSAKEPELHFRFQHYLMKHSSVNGLVNDKTVSDLYDMLLEHSRKYLDVQPAVPLAGAMQAKGKDYPNAQKQSSSRNFPPNTCFYCGSADHWMKDCPHRAGSSAGSKGQSSNSGGKGQSGKPKPKSVPTPKGSNKGKGKGKGDSKKKPPRYSSGQGNRPSAKECNGEYDEEAPESDQGSQGYKSSLTNLWIHFNIMRRRRNRNIKKKFHQRRRLNQYWQLCRISRSKDKQKGRLQQQLK